MKKLLPLGITLLTTVMSLIVAIYMVFKAENPDEIELNHAFIAMAQLPVIALNLFMFYIVSVLLEHRERHLKGLERLRQCIGIQCHSGNWDFDPYMHGYANGMILAEVVMTNSDIKFLDAPKKWLCDKDPLGDAIDEAQGAAVQFMDILNQDAATGSAMSGVIPTCKQIDQALSNVHEGQCQYCGTTGDHHAHECPVTVKNDRDEYFKENDRLNRGINEIVNELQEEIDSRQDYPNVGKRGCLARLQTLKGGK